MKMIKSLLLVTLLATLYGCATNPVTGKNEFSLVSQQQEIAMGEQHYASSIQMQGGEYYLDSKVNSYVNSVGQKLARLSHQPNLPYEFTVINSSVPNAWALPGGKVAINRGLLMMLDDEAQLAAVLGHEIVHVTARHSAQQQTQAALLGIGGSIAQAAAGGLGGLVSETLNIGGGMIMAKYGRDDELESDYYGTQYISAAGYDPIASFELQHKLMSLKDGQQQNALSTLFASHPPSQERMSRNKQTAASLPGKVRNRQQYQQNMARLFKDFPAYQHYDKAEKYHQEKSYDKVISELNRAIKIQPRESSFWILKGQALWLKKQKSQALSAYSTAVKYDPKHIKPYILRGMSYYDTGNLTAAEKDFRKADSILNTRIASFYRGEIAFDKKQFVTAKNYYMPVAQGSDELANAARQKLAAIQELQAQ
jgi:predicted Zn-dependent protease